jgi:hypothetical protein
MQNNTRTARAGDAHFAPSPSAVGALFVLFSFLLGATGCDVVLGDGNADSGGTSSVPVINPEGHPGNAEVLVSWINPDYPGRDGIEIRWSPGDGEVVSTDLDKQQYLIPGLRNGINYTILVSSVNRTGDRSEAIELIVQPTDDSEIIRSTGEGLSPDGGVSVTDTSPVFSWSVSAPTQQYEVQILEVETADITTVVVQGTEYRPERPLNRDGSYKWRVRPSGEASQTGLWSEMADFSVPQRTEYVVGERGPGGGTVFYAKARFSDGWRYLEAAPEATEWSGNTPWGGRGTLVGYAEMGLGTGAANTRRIVATYGDREPYENRPDYAARLCYDMTFGGYSDWYLPSMEELDRMYNRRGTIGGFHRGYYWSSSELGAYHALAQDFSNGVQGDYGKYGTGPHVRAIRSF